LKFKSEGFSFMKAPAMFMLLPIAFVAMVACSSSNENADQNSAEGGRGGSEQAAGGNAGSPSSASGGSAASGSGGSSSVAGMSAGGASGGAGGSKPNVDAGTTPIKMDAGTDAGSNPNPTTAQYECSAFIGPNVTGEWFAAGFETLAPNDKWQVKAPHHSFVEDWANPNHAVWKEACEGTYSDCQTKSKCAGGKTPDRIVFVTQTGNYLGTSQQGWETLIGSAIPTIKAKFPGVKNIELMTFVRGPGNKDCGTETTVSQNLDKAQKALADASAGFITVSPRFEVTTCAHFGSAPHLTGEGNKAVAQLMGKHYAK
jgi:hypothetical protein